MEAEQAVLGAAMLDRDCRDRVLEMLEPADFWTDAHQQIYGAIAKASEQGHAVDTIGIRSQLGTKLEGVGGDEYLLSLTEVIPTAGLTTQHASRLQKLASVRGHIARAHKIAAGGYGDIPDLDAWLDATEQSLSETPGRRGVAQSASFGEVIQETYSEIQKQAETNTDLVGLPTGIHKLDRLLLGMSGGEFIVVAGRPGMGKSAYSGGCVTTVAEAGVTCAVFSLEMPKVQWGRRYLSQAAQIDGRVLRSAKGLEREHWARLSQAAGKGEGLPIHFWDKASTSIRELLSECRRIDRADRAGGGDGLGFVVVDYLQLLRGSGAGRSREEDVAECSRELKGLAMELNIPVMALAQLNRGVEQRPSKRPMLSDLRESGAIEQDADVVKFIYRDDVYNPYRANKSPPMEDLRTVAEIIVAKNRSGAVGTAKAAWFKQFTQFANLDEEHDDDGPLAPTHWQDENQ